MFDFTDDQRMALEFPGNVIVSAGAGSGKTRVLVEKYFRLLVDEHPTWSVESVVAITFTRKAASELKARIVHRILDELQVETVPGARRQRLHELRAEVGAAPIGTIHNFCGRILREFAFDAHIDPDFAILEGAQDGALRLRAARETIAAVTATREDQLYRDLLVMLNLLTVSRLTQLLSTMLAKRAVYVAPALLYADSKTDELYADLVEFHTRYVNSRRADMASKWHNMLLEIQRRCLEGKVKDIVNHALHQWPADQVMQWTHIEEILTYVIDGLLTKGKLTCRTREFDKAGIEGFDGIRDSLQDLAREYTKTNLGDLDHGDRQDIERTQRLARLFLKAVEVYAALRGGTADGEAQLLDFSDMEILAGKLIGSSAAVRQKIRERYPYIIIDEFQDTSQAQWDILMPLATDENGELRQNSLFVVGDKKQGVYGFRDANVSLFSKVQAMVKQSNDEWNASRGVVSMAANFRTAPVPLTLINRVFENLLTSAGNTYAVEFEPLAAMKTDKQGCVEFLLAASKTLDSDSEILVASDSNSDSDPITEARLVAAHIQQLISNNEANPGDIALLFRKRSVFAEYEKALKDLGIPVVSQQGANLFQQPELADMVAALNAVAYPHRDLVFVHYLRSPLIGFTDDLLLKIARTRGRSYYDKANVVFSERKYQLDDGWHDLSDSEIERLDFALSLLRRTRSRVGAVPPYHIVRYMMDELGAYHSALAANRGHQAQANLEKLLHLARNAESLSFEDFLDYIKSEEQSLNGTTEAIDLTTADAVKIMTIHGAKGLEFPVVYLPALNSGTSGGADEVSSDGARWMTLRLSKSLIEKQSFLMDYFSEVARQQQNAEERRIFYVAMTRCENRLILSADETTRARGETFYQWIAGEFEQGGRENLLKKPEDFTFAEIGYRNNKSSGQNTKASREHRIEAALRLATEITSEQKQHSQFVAETVQSVNPLLDKLLRRFLQMSLTQPIESCLGECLPEIKFLVSNSELELWPARLTYLFEWLHEQSNAVNSITVSPVLRIGQNRAITTFNPHLRLNDKYIWISFASDPADPAEVTRFANLISSSSSAPLIEVIRILDETVMSKQT